jgi:hypothetical protein
MMYQKVYNFANGYGASVICNSMSYGGYDGHFEIAVTKDGSICYNTPITDDVIGNLDFSGVAKILKDIESLPPAK